MNTPYVAGIDCDGVIADYFEGFRQVVAYAKGLPPEELPVPDHYDFVSDPHWAKILPDREEFLKLHSYAVRSGLFRHLDPIEGAKEALWDLSNSGIYVRIITHRLHTKGDYGFVLQETAKWLDDQDIPYRGISFERYKTQVGADIYVEDSPGNVQELRAAGSDCIVFDAPYNREVPGLRAHSWPTVVEIIKERAADRGL